MNLRQSFTGFLPAFIALLLSLLLMNCSGSRKLSATRSNTPVTKSKTNENTGSLAKPVFIDSEVRLFDFAEAENGAHLFVPQKKVKAHAVVVFVHGYGGLNPFIYGGWIRHLVNEGHVVIYPRYQEKILKPSPREFVPNTVIGIKDAFDQLKALNIDIDPNNFHLVGHSYGGVIVSNLSATYKTHQIPKPKSVFVCQGGTGPFKGGILEDYSGIPATTLLTIIVGDNDQTVGTKFGEYLLSKVEHVKNQTYVHQFEKESVPFTASHYEPYSIDRTFDNGNENFTSKKSLRVAKLDAIDTKLYWPIFDQMIYQSNLKKAEPLSHSIHELLKAFDDGSFVEIK